MGRYELWVREDGDGHYFFRDDNLQARTMAIADGFHLSWETTQRGRNQAHQALYEHLGWGRYAPMFRSDGTAFPEDEDDSI